MLVIFGGNIFHMRIAQGRINEKTIAFIHLGLRIVHGFESGLAGLEGVILIMLFRILKDVTKFII